MASTVYAMESMAYLVSGTIDKYEKPDQSVEAAMIKVVSYKVIPFLLMYYSNVLCL
jgi:hypothetical protein